MTINLYCLIPRKIGNLRAPVLSYGWMLEAGNLKFTYSHRVFVNKYATPAKTFSYSRGQNFKLFCWIKRDTFQLFPFFVAKPKNQNLLNNPHIIG